ncbi:MAG: hypothetical protein SFV53_05240 [Rickettsiales bacterium]|nr:hypothetical protein [Rickettsiales bacterium]
MSQQDFEIRFDKARAHLNSSLKELEKAIFEKLHQTSIQSKILQASDKLEDSSAELSEQFSIIQNLSEEVNRLQSSLDNLATDNDILAEENKNLRKFNSQKSSLIDAIESDLIKIEEIILGQENDRS